MDFNYGDRLELFRKSLGLTQAQLGEILGRSQASYASLENEVNGLAHEFTKTLLNCFPTINIDWLYTGRGSMRIGEQPAVVPVRGPILSPIPAGAGYTGEYSQEWVDQNPSRIALMGVGNEGFVFPITGDSMYPLISSGDYAIAYPHALAQGFRRGSPYIVATCADGLVCKYLSAVPDNPQKLRFSSENEPLFRPYEYDLEEVIRIWRVAQVFKNL